jgi:hypothetical protein
MRCGYHFGGSHRLVVVSGHHCALDHSLVRFDRDVLYNDLLLSATSVVIKPPTKSELAIKLKPAKAIGADVPLRSLRADKLIEYIADVAVWPEAAVRCRSDTSEVGGEADMPCQDGPTDAIDPFRKSRVHRNSRASV